MTITLYELTGRDATRPFSPHCWKTVMSLAHKGLDWSSVPTPFTAIPSIAEGAKTVPVIRDGERLVTDSFAIALYLEEAYSDRPSLFGGEGGIALSRFVEQWAFTRIHSVLGMAAIMDIHDCLAPEDQAHFRTTRETRFGMPIEEVREKGTGMLDQLDARLEPLRAMLKHQPFLGGKSPLFADYIVFGAFQWIRVTMPRPLLKPEDPVLEWFESCLDLYGGIGRSVPSAAA